MKPLRLALLSLLLAVLVAAPARASVPRDFVGIVSDDVFAGAPGYRDSTLSAQQGAGIGIIRQTFDWSQIERSRGRYDFSVYDAYVAAAASHGIKVLPVLFNPPSFRSSKPKRHAKPGTYFPAHYSDLGTFGAAVARRYGPNGSFWTQRPDVPKVPITAYQVWNEPNLPAYSPPKPDARKYVALLKATARGIRAAYSGAEIVTAGLPDSKLSQPNVYAFITAMYQAGARGSFNTLAVNPYAPTSGSLISKLKKVRGIMRRFHDSGASLWVTEMGWSDNGPRYFLRVGAAGQASRIKQSIPALARARGSLKLRGFFYYSWRDGRPYAPRFQDFWGLHTGLLNLNGSAKPAFAAFKSAVAAVLH